ncbi:unnamed protein product [Cercopithifilaria johnstoni]|uniref:G-protein coupled receptors family 1 profile domain-containing protein n=1 Tax=Cercopithifilaria johnstoni TaxID=2874296 RepID=A0A8J2MIH4_9BILA|nr:unnamed protein product [Cercopithifilaria johnstoni]
MNITTNDYDDSGKLKEDNQLFFIITFAIYAFEGFILVISNGLIGIALIKHQYLRRQYLILFVQAFADTMLGASFSLTAIYRLVMMKFGYYRKTRRNCLLLPWFTLGIWSELVSATATLMVSTDRIILFISPMRYYENNYVYQIRQIIVFFGSASLFVVVFWFISFSDNETMLHGFCWTGDILYSFFADLQFLLMITTTSLSVILYVVVYFLSRKHLHRIKSNRPEASLQLFEARQRKLTITMGVSCVFTLIFYVLPLCSKLLMGDSDNDPTTRYSKFIRAAVAISCNVNPLTNVAAIMIKQDDIACRVKELLPKCIHKNICHRETVAAITTASIRVIAPRKY